MTVNRREFLELTLASSLFPGIPASAHGQSAAKFVAELQKTDPAGFSILAELVAGAYFMNAQVRARLDYHGQGPRPMDPHPDYLDHGLLQAVIDRGPVYRPTPRRDRD